MEDFYKMLLGWLVAVIMAIYAAYSSRASKAEADDRKRESDDKEVLHQRIGHLQGKVDSHKTILTDHEKAIAVQEANMKNLRETVTAIKTSVETIQGRMDKNDREVNKKLDQLLNRP